MCGCVWCVFVVVCCLLFVVVCCCLLLFVVVWIVVFFVNVNVVKCVCVSVCVNAARKHVVCHKLRNDLCATYGCVVSLFRCLFRLCVSLSLCLSVSLFLLFFLFCVFCVFCVFFCVFVSAVVLW